MVVSDTLLTQFKERGYIQVTSMVFGISLVVCFLWFFGVTSPIGE